MNIRDMDADFVRERVADELRGSLADFGIVSDGDYDGIYAGIDPSTDEVIVTISLGAECRKFKVNVTEIV